MNIVLVKDLKKSCVMIPVDGKKEDVVIYIGLTEATEKERLGGFLVQAFKEIKEMNIITNRELAELTEEENISKLSLEKFKEVQELVYLQEPIKTSTDIKSQVEKMSIRELLVLHESYSVLIPKTDADCQKSLAVIDEISNRHGDIYQKYIMDKCKYVSCEIWENPKIMDYFKEVVN